MTDKVFEGKVENKTEKVFEGKVKNVADGDIFDITITTVDSVPCVDPYCDHIIAVEKAEIREGLCADCYKQKVRAEQTLIARKQLSQFYVAVALMVIGLAHLIANQILNALHKPPILPLIPEIWLGLLWTLVIFYRIWKGQNEVEEKRDLRKNLK